MKVNRSILLKALDTVEMAVDKNFVGEDQISIVGNRIIAANPHVITSSVVEGLEFHNEVAVSYSLIVQILKNITTEEIDLICEKSNIKIIAESFEAKIPFCNSDDDRDKMVQEFDNKRDEAEILIFPEDFWKWMKICVETTSKDLFFPALTSVYITKDEMRSGDRFAATVLSRGISELPDKSSLLFPTRGKIGQSLISLAPLKYFYTSNVIGLIGDKFCVYLRLDENESFPDFGSATEITNDMVQIQVDCKNLISALRRVTVLSQSLVTGGKEITLKVGLEEMIVQSTSESGEAMEKLQIQNKSGKKIEISLDSDKFFTIISTPDDIERIYIGKTKIIVCGEKFKRILAALAGDQKQ